MSANKQRSWLYLICVNRLLMPLLLQLRKTHEFQKKVRECVKVASNRTLGFCRFFLQQFSYRCIFSNYPIYIVKSVHFEKELLKTQSMELMSLNASLFKICLLFISYKFVNGFLAITFLLLVISNWNFHNMCQRFLYTCNQVQNFSLIRQMTKDFPERPPL